MKKLLVLLFEPPRKKANLVPVEIKRPFYRIPKYTCYE